MTQLSQLLDDVADVHSHSLASVLMRAKVMAARLSSPTFREWVDKELNGYNDKVDVPDYRRVCPCILGDFWGMFGSKVQNVRLSTNGLKPSIREIIEIYHFTDNVGAIEEMLKADTETFHHHWEGTIIEHMRRSPGTRVDNHILQCAQSIFTKPDVQGVLHAIRSRLLDLLLQLRDEYPELEAQDSAITNVSPDFVGQLVQKVIYNNCYVTGATGMTNSNINAGRDISVGRDFVIATTIQDSFKHIEDSTVSPELVSALEDLVRSLKAIQSQLDQEAAENLAQDGKTLVVEVTKDRPRKPIVLAVGEAIKSTVETLGKVAVPLITAVEKVMKMVDAGGTG